MKHFISLFILLAMLSGCSDSKKDKQEVPELTPEQIAEQKRLDSLALKVGTMPTLDCLPLYVAREENIFKELGVEVRLKLFTAQMDCDTALVGGSVNAAVSDLVRVTRLHSKGTELELLTQTNSVWTMMCNRNARIKNLSQLNDKTIGMTRFSATHMLAQHALDSLNLSMDKVFFIQANNVKIRYRMLTGRQIDAAWMSEPWTTMTRIGGCNEVFSSDDMGLSLGTFAVRKKDIAKNDLKKEQVDKLLQAYDQAVDSINKKGISHYSKLISSYCDIPQAYADSVSKNKSIRFSHHATPRDKDKDAALKALNRL